MRYWSTIERRLGAAALVLGLIFGPAVPLARAQNVDLDAVGAALALPLLADEGRRTSIVVTNHGSAEAWLFVLAISGDPGDDWGAASFSCLVTGHETTVFQVEPYGDGSRISFECSAPGATADSHPDDLNIERSEVTAAAQGILWVALARGDANISSGNFLSGHAIIVDDVEGSAFHLPAIPFRGGDALAQDGNLEFRFDGLEYASFPSVLTTSFLAPSYTDDGAGGLAPAIGAELILFTLDGTIGSEETPRARLRVNFYNDDERMRDTTFEFDCFTIVDLETLDARFAADLLGSATGHLRLVPQAVSNSNLAHDLQFDGPPDGVRTPPVHGWLVQRIHAGGPLPSGTVFPAESGGRWGRALSQGSFSVTPAPGDVPVLNAQ